MGAPIKNINGKRDLKVHMLGGPVSNAWLVRTGYGHVLIDTGFFLMWPAVLAGLHKYGLTPDELSAVILTHRHRDHADNAYRFQKAGVPVYAHEKDAQIMTGVTRPPILNGRKGPVAWMSRLENQHPVRLKTVEILKDHDKIAGFDVIHCPGHTMGSIFLYHAGSGSLFTGDGLLNAVPPYVQKTALSLPYPDFCDDYTAALECLKNFADQGPDIRTLYPGHGPARTGPIRREIKDLLISLKNI